MKQLMRRILPKMLNDRLSRVIWRQLSPSRRLTSGLIVQVKSIAEWAIYNDIFVDGEYDVAIDLLLQKNGSIPLIVDIGANVGYFTLRFADKWLREKGTDQKFKLIGVEGNPATYTDLMKRVNQPGLFEHCQFHKGLIGARQGMGYLSASPLHVTDSIVQKPSRFTLAIPFIDLDSLIPTNQPITLLKCDIEGAEKSFIENYPDLLRRVELAVFELHPEKCDTVRCFELLRVAGLAHYTNIRISTGFRVDVFRRAE